MALVRHEVQQYPNPAALTAETVVPTNNDEAHIESLNRRFNWLEGSQAVADNKYVIDQTSQTANGRWAATAVEGAKVFTGTGNTGVIPNGNTSVFTVALADGASSVLATTSGAALGITNGGAFPTNVFLDSIVLTADNTAQLTVRNESGVEVPAFNVDVKAIDYTGVAVAAAAAAAAAAKRVEYGRVSDPKAREVQVTFAVPFSATPFITLTAVCTSTGNGADTIIKQETNNGFILRRGGSYSSGTLPDVDWKAEEK